MTSDNPLRNEVREIAIAVVEWDGNYLVGVRPAGAPLEGFSEFPGGKIERGEPPAAAAERECQEETGLIVEVVRLLLVHEQQYPHAHLRLHFYSCRPATIPPAPVAEPWRWVSTSELLQRTFPPANQPLLENIRRDWIDHGR
ncbi:MAG: (deoxy)nucleoside triphosphate pyrophosphohydrolase [Planctomycetes bacterium]|nr:(deoxy)nucleoside triphosphate pyrophosphohydrolase [Planctomycetota bacterium]